MTEFIAKSMNYGIVPEGLPESVSAIVAARKFGEMNDVRLKSLEMNGHYFCGWFPEGGRKILTIDGKHLFTLIGPTTIPFLYRLKIEPDGLELMNRQ